MIEEIDSMKTEDFAAQYQTLSDDDITQLASEGGLRPEADIALKAEMRRRSIGAGEVSALRERQEKTKLQMAVGHNPCHRGCGLQLRGEEFLDETDRQRGVATVTRWIVFFYMPIIPIGSYQVTRSADSGNNPEIIGKANLQWDQVFRGWMTTALILLAVTCALQLLDWWVISHSQMAR